MIFIIKFINEDLMGEFVRNFSEVMCEILIENVNVY